MRSIGIRYSQLSTNIKERYQNWRNRRVINQIAQINIANNAPPEEAYERAVNEVRGVFYHRNSVSSDSVGPEPNNLSLLNAQQVQFQNQAIGPELIN
ncbi:MAG: hypothetical protein ACJA0S_001243 [Rickettsiales bacterium]|jgi:hypothetical protein